MVAIGGFRTTLAALRVLLDHDDPIVMVIQCYLHYTTVCASLSTNALGIRQCVAIIFLSLAPRWMP